MKSTTITSNEHGTRLDIALTTLLEVSRSQVKKMITHDRILINDKAPKKSGDIVHEGDKITILPALAEKVFEEVTESVDTSLSPEVVKETDDYLLIDKPAGLLSHPTQAGEPWSLSHWVWKNYPALKTVGEYADRPGIVHRLDKDTSGLMIIAKTQPMFDHLKEQFKGREIDKNYTALVHGNLERDTDIVDFDIDRGKDGRMVARPKTDNLLLRNVGKDQPGKYAKSEFFVHGRYSRYTLVDIKIYTGRTHQIRVHMFAYGNPVVGDPLYTQNSINQNLDKSIGRLFLHATSLAFSDLDGERIETTIPLAAELQTVLDTLN
jgi:23S rRNA pseudouridine1911/1915/1917 synthase